MYSATYFCNCKGDVAAGLGVFNIDTRFPLILYQNPVSNHPVNSLIVP